MAISITGIAVWSVAHLLASVESTTRGHLIERRGTNPYRVSMQRLGNKTSLFYQTASIGTRSRFRPSPETLTGGTT